MSAQQTLLIYTPRGELLIWYSSLDIGKHGDYEVIAPIPSTISFISSQLNRLVGIYVVLLNAHWSGNAYRHRELASPCSL